MDLTDRGYELDGFQIEVGDLAKEMHQTTWSGEDNIRILRKSLEVLLDRLSSDYHAGTQICKVRELSTDLIGLVS